MAENLILPFAQGQGANVMSQTDYAGDSMRLQGHQPGVARSALENKALRQCSSMASGLAQYIVDMAEINISDDNTPQEISSALQNGVAKQFTRISDIVGLGRSTGRWRAPDGTLFQWVYFSWNGGTARVRGEVSYAVAFPTHIYTTSATILSATAAGASYQYVVSARPSSLAKLSYDITMTDGSVVTGGSAMSLSIGY